MNDAPRRGYAAPRTGLAMRALIVALLLGVVALIAPTAGESETPVTVRVMTNPIDSGAEVFYAKDLGLFAKAGLDVQIQPGQNGAASRRRSRRTRSTSGTRTLARSLAHTRGIPFTIVAPAAMWVASAPVNELMVAKRSPIRSARDLDGKTIAVPGLGTNAEYAVHAWLDANAADARTVKFIELSYTAMPAALESGRVDAAHVAEPFIAVAKQSGRVLAAADDALGKAYLRTVWFGSSAWVRDHPDVVARFAQVIRETAAWANDPRNHAKSAAILVKYTKIEPAVVATMTRVHYGESLDPALLQPEIDTNARYGGFASFPATALLPQR